jgi:hypothetical protein
MRKNESSLNLCKACLMLMMDLLNGAVDTSAPLSVSQNGKAIVTFNPLTDSKDVDQFFSRKAAGQSNSVENGLMIVAFPRLQIMVCFCKSRIYRLIHI